jgi:hypothetical protein
VISLEDVVDQCGFPTAEKTGDDAHAHGHGGPSYEVDWKLVPRRARARVVIETGSVEMQL